jgi:hypothetical protein
MDAADQSGLLRPLIQALRIAAAAPSKAPATMSQTVSAQADPSPSSSHRRGWTMAARMKAPTPAHSRIVDRLT